jgi:flagellar assembly protein FliH
MTSLSENASADDSLPGMPVRLLTGELARKDVSRLEFHAMDWPRTESVHEVESGPALVAEVRLQERVMVLEGELKLQAQQIATQLEVARRGAVTESRQKWEEELEVRVAVERTRVMRTCEEFGKERAQYFSNVEAEVVKLALAIAARVLHREVKLDPLLLCAAVRVALEKLEDSSTMQLRVPFDDVEKWRHVIRSETEPRVRLIGDERLGPGQCVLETNVGRVELGVSAQLEEIEKGFFDLLQQRPA